MSGRSRALTVILFLLAAALLAVACGGSDGDDGSDGTDEGNSGNLPEAADVAAVWQGTYTSPETGRQGAFCLDIERNDRELAGQIVFEGSAPASVSGRVTGELLNFIWTPVTVGGEEMQSGSMIGGLEGDSLSGTWAGFGQDSGDWSAQRQDASSCS